MQPTPHGGPAAPDEPPPLGSWPRAYAATLALAALVIALLWWLTVAGNVPLGSAR